MSPMQDQPHTPQAPGRSLTQRMEALHRANRIRIRRAEYKRDLKAGRENIIDVLAEPPAWLATAKVFDVLLAVPKYGRVKTNKVLVQCRISPSKTIGGLSVRQRTELASMIRRPSDRPAAAPGPRLEHLLRPPAPAPPAVTMAAMADRNRVVAPGAPPPGRARRRSGVEPWSQLRASID